MKIIAILLVFAGAQAALAKNPDRLCKGRTEDGKKIVLSFDSVGLAADCEGKFYRLSTRESRNDEKREFRSDEHGGFKIRFSKDQKKLKGESAKLGRFKMKCQGASDANEPDEEIDGDGGFEYESPFST